MPKGIKKVPKTHCKRGHEFTVKNTYVDNRGRRSCLTCKYSPRMREKWARYNANLKIAVLTRYSPNGVLKCSWEGCCVSDPDMLSLDHVDNDGAKFRKTHISGTGTYKYVRKNGYPDGYQTLCHNHQWKKQLTYLRLHGRPELRKNIL